MLALGETAALGAFCAQDLALFVLFFDLMLVPFYFLIGIWGGERPRRGDDQVRHLHAGRQPADAGRPRSPPASSPPGRRARRLRAGRPAQRTRSPSGTQDWIFLFFAAAFLVKMPAFPLHGWMPDAYRAAPTPVLAVLSGVLSKVGAYGFLRIVLPLYPGRDGPLPGAAAGDRGRRASSTAR